MDEDEERWDVGEKVDPTRSPREEIPSDFNGSEATRL
jgi:hypothetical protein